MVICLERGADLHMAQLMPLPLTVSCFSQIQIAFTFLVPAHPGSHGQMAVKLVCVCVWLAIQQNIWSMVVRATLKYDDPRFKMLHSGCSLVRHFQPLVVHSISMSTHYHASSVYCSKWLSLLHSVDNFAITNKQSFNLCNWKQGFLKIVGKE